jgi:mannose-1-phosphate guanylyltransferase/mannose-6-phosphate isomerase
VRTRTALAVFRHPGGGFREVGAHPFQANAQMHLLEAALAWEDAGGDADWAALVDEIVELAMARFIDPAGFLREFFDAEWRPAAGDDGRRVEPGHQFQWAWLLERWSRRRRDPRAGAAARRLFELGLRGLDLQREVAVNLLWDDLSVRDGSARLWPQTKYLKAALILGEGRHALTAARPDSGTRPRAVPGHADPRRLARQDAGRRQLR